MKKILLIAIGFYCLNCYSQEKEVKYFNNKWKTTKENRAQFIREIIKENQSLYIVTDFHKSGAIYMKGQFSSINPMIENGYFEFYDYDNYKKVATGYYTDGVMTGDWIFTDYGGVYRKVNYDLNLLILEDISEDKTDSDSDVINVLEMPKFQGSKDLQDFVDYIAQNLIYPPMPLRYNIEDRVILQFNLNSRGQVCSIEVKNKVHKDLEREAMRVVSQSPDWTPGYQNGKAVNIQFTFPLNFKIR